MNNSDSPKRFNLAGAAPSRAAFLPQEWRLLRRLNTPRRVQQFLRGLRYNRETHGDTLRSFRGVLRTGEAHCLEGALTAAVILEQHGYPPLLLDLESQDLLDHVLFLFRQGGRYGTVARSRDAGLHGRKAVFRTVRDLVMSYIDPYVDGSGRVIGYGVLDLRLLRRSDWRLADHNVWAVERALIEMPHKRLSTSDRRYQTTLSRFQKFRREHPDTPVTFYSSRPLWL